MGLGVELEEHKEMPKLAPRGEGTEWMPDERGWARAGLGHSGSHSRHTHLLLTSKESAA